MFNKNNKHVVLSKKELDKLLKEMSPSERRKFLAKQKKYKKQQENERLFDAFCAGIFMEDE